MKFTTLATPLVLLCTAALAAPSWNDTLEKGKAPVVEVNGEVITLQEVYGEVMRRHARATLAEMVQRRLVAQAAKKAEVAVSGEEIEARVAEVRERVLADAQREAKARGEDPAKLDAEKVFAAWLHQSYPDDAEFRRHLETILLAEKVLARSVTVEDSELATLQARVITLSPGKHDLAEAVRLAEELRAKIAAGADFATVATASSEDEFAAKGGALPVFHAGDILLPVERAAVQALLRLKPGEITPVVKGDYGCYILKLESLQPAKELGLLEREELRRRMVRERIEAIRNAWLQKLKAEATLLVRDKRFE